MAAADPMAWDDPTGGLMDKDDRVAVWGGLTADPMVWAMDDPMALGRATDRAWAMATGLAADLMALMALDDLTAAWGDPTADPAAWDRVADLMAWAMGDLTALDRDNDQA